MEYKLLFGILLFVVIVLVVASFIPVDSNAGVEESIDYAFDDALAKKALDRLTSYEFLSGSTERQQEVIHEMHDLHYFPSFITTDCQSLPDIMGRLSRRSGETVEMIDLR